MIDVIDFKYIILDEKTIAVLEKSTQGDLQADHYKQETAELERLGFGYYTQSSTITNDDNYAVELFQRQLLQHFDGARARRIQQQLVEALTHPRRAALVLGQVRGMELASVVPVA
mgnify:CR=1 FL=1